jgi:hypothetical protein
MEQGAIEQEAVSFIFKVIFWIVTGVVSLLLIFVWNLFNKVQENKDITQNIKESLEEKISSLKLKLAVNTERDGHIDKELIAIRDWMISIDKKIDDLRK